MLPDNHSVKSLHMLTFSKLALVGSHSIQLSSVVLRDTQQRPHELRQLLCTQAAPALFVKQLQSKHCAIR